MNKQTKTYSNTPVTIYSKQIIVQMVSEYIRVIASDYEARPRDHAITMLLHFYCVLDYQLMIPGEHFSLGKI